MMNLLERLHETHNLKTPDQLSLDRINCFSLKKTMEKKPKRNKTELYYFSVSITNMVKKNQ